MAIQVAGKRVECSFKTFKEAKAAAKSKLKELTKGNQAAGLSAKEAADALAIRQALDASYRSVYPALEVAVLKLARLPTALGCPPAALAD